MVNKQPTFDEAARHPEKFEKRQFTITRHGLKHKSSDAIYFNCPFCKIEVKAYVWSLGGGGKICQCGALFTGDGIARHYKNGD